MHTLSEILRYLSLGAFVVLALVTFRRWRIRHDEPSKWAWVTFLTLGGVAVVGLFLPEHSDARSVEYARKIAIVVILLFPYFLYRMAASFDRTDHWFDKLAPVLTGAVALWALLLPTIPEEGEVRPASFSAFIVALLLQWVVLSGAVAFKFWRAGEGQPSVARKRMRMLSGASVALSIALVIAGASGRTQSVGSEVATQALALVSVLAFFVAFAPPDILRMAWRRPVEESFRRATLDLMASESADDVMSVLLPHAIGIVGGEGVAVLDQAGTVLGSRGMTEDALVREDEAGADIVHLEFPFGSIIVRTGPYTPFFGRDEIDLLGALGALANLALERISAGDLRMQLAAVQLRRRQALEINDNIVQGLAVAKYSFDLGQEEKARAAIEGTLVAARGIISELVDELGDDLAFGPTSLMRDEAATAYVESNPSDEPGQDQ